MNTSYLLIKSLECYLYEEAKANCYLWLKAVVRIRALPSWCQPLIFPAAGGKNGSNNDIVKKKKKKQLKGFVERIYLFLIL